MSDPWRIDVAVECNEESMVVVLGDDATVPSTDIDGRSSPPSPQPPR